MNMWDLWDGWDLWIRYATSTIIGATTLEQLQENIDAFTVELSQETLEAVDRVHLECRDPCMDL